MGITYFAIATLFLAFASGATAYLFWEQNTLSQKALGVAQRNHAELQERLAKMDAHARQAMAKNETFEASLATEQAQKQAAIASQKTIAEELFQALKDWESTTEINSSNEIVVALQSQGVFEGDQLSALGTEILRKLGEVCRRFPENEVIVRGFPATDLAADAGTDWQASSVRAASAANFLQNTMGLDPRLLAATGTSRYAATGDTEVSFTISAK